MKIGIDSFGCGHGKSGIGSYLSSLSSLLKNSADCTFEIFGSEIDRYERDIETLCLRLLLQQQPVARDLRQISAALKMITDLERIGDHAVNITECALMAAGSQNAQQE